MSAAHGNADATPPGSPVREQEPDTTENELVDAIGALSTASSKSPATASSSSSAASATATSAAAAKGGDGDGDGDDDPSVPVKPKHAGLADTHTKLRVVADQSNPNSPLYSVKSFEELGLSRQLLDGVYAMGYAKPSRIQEHALPLVITAKKNLIAQAQSGTGKTAAFTLSMLALSDPNVKRPQALCVCPTRELARQNADVCMQMMKFTQLKCTLIVKDGAWANRIESQIIIGTPGKVIDAITKKQLDLSALRIFVLDEADVMVDTQGHGVVLRKIKKLVPPSALTLLFSATYADKVREMAKKLVPEPCATIELAAENVSLDKIRNLVIDCAAPGTGRDERDAVVDEIFGYLAVGSAILFVRTKKMAETLAARMQADGFAVICLTGAHSPDERDAIVDSFRSGKERVLICTDVLARGFDMMSVNVVINVDFPSDQDGRPSTETYVHRAGRTARFGAEGICINLVHDAGSRKAYESISRELQRKFESLARSDIRQLAEWLQAFS